MIPWRKSTKQSPKGARFDSPGRGRGQVGNLVLKAPNCGETRVFTVHAAPHPALAASEKGEPEAVRPRRRLGVKQLKCNRARLVWKVSISTARSIAAQASLSTILPARPETARDYRGFYHITRPDRMGRLTWFEALAQLNCRFCKACFQQSSEGIACLCNRHALPSGSRLNFVRQAFQPDRSAKAASAPLKAVLGAAGCRM